MAIEDTPTTDVASKHVIDRLTTLRDKADRDSALAQRESWDWLAELGRADDHAALSALFGHGVAESPRARTLGMPVGPMRNIPGGGFITAVLSLDSPWTGKTFDADGSGGYNRVKLYAAPVVAALTRSLHRKGREIATFSFDTTIGPGAVEPHVDVLAIEYGRPEHGNPTKIFPLTRIRDELVRILPGVYLGRATYRRAPGDYVLVGYFALQHPIETKS